MDCGAAGGACCPGNVCQTGSECVAGAAGSDGGRMCRACGGANQVCCAATAGGAATCDDGFRCAMTGDGGTARSCQACGGMNQACCPGRMCDVGNCMGVTNPTCM